MARDIILFIHMYDLIGTPCYESGVVRLVPSVIYVQELVIGLSLQLN